MQSATFLSTA